MEAKIEDIYMTVKLGWAGLDPWSSALYYATLTHHSYVRPGVYSEVGNRKRKTFTPNGKRFATETVVSIGHIPVSPSPFRSVCFCLVPIEYTPGS